MVDILDKEGNPIPDPNKEPGNNLSYHIDRKMIKYLDNIKTKINSKDKDYVLIVDGYEGSGKSTLAQQMGKYIDPTLNLSRICMTADEFKQAISTADKGQCVIYDEAVTGMAAGDSISRIGKLLKSMMMQMRQKNLFVIVIIPTIFEMGKYVVLSRARALMHVYEKHGRMGYWVGYNKKDLKTLYLLGKKTYSIRVRSRFIGRFYGKYVVDEEAYRKKKEEALFKIDEADKESNYSERDALIYAVYNISKSSMVNIEQLLREKYGINISKSTIGRAIQRYERNAPSIIPNSHPK